MHLCSGAKMNSNLIKILLLMSAAMLFVNLLNSEPTVGNANSRPSYSQFLEEVKRGEISEVVVDGQEIRGKRSNGEIFRTFSPDDPGLVGDLIENGVEIKAAPPAKPSLIGQLLMSVLPLVLILGHAVFFMRRMQGGVGGSGV